MNHRPENPSKETPAIGVILLAFSPKIEKLPEKPLGRMVPKMYETIRDPMKSKIGNMYNLSSILPVFIPVLSIKYRRFVVHDINSCT